MPVNLELGFIANIFNQQGDDGELIAALLAMANHIRLPVSPSVLITRHCGDTVIATTHKDGRRVWLKARHGLYYSGVTITAGYWSSDEPRVSAIALCEEETTSWNYKDATPPEGWLEEQKEIVRESHDLAFEVFCWFVE